jgi:hypothetical protein
MNTVLSNFFTGAVPDEQCEKQASLYAYTLAKKCEQCLRLTTHDSQVLIELIFKTNKPDNLSTGCRGKA